MTVAGRARMCRRPTRAERPRGDQHDDGQAAVELAIALPVVVLLLLAVLQVGLVVRDQIAVVHAAREAARAAAVFEGTAAEGIEAGRAATRLDPGRLDVEVSRSDLVRATVTYRSPTDLPLVGRLVGDVTLHASATMRPEP